jgi:hypothetical protein
MAPINPDEQLCQLSEGFETLEDAQKYARGIFQIIEVPKYNCIYVPGVNDSEHEDLDAEAESNYQKEAI